MDGIGGPELRHAGLNLADASRGSREQAESDVFGFWIFLMSDAVLFALLFAIYGTALGATVGAPGPAQEFKIGPAVIETLLLLTSSFTFGMASIALKQDVRAKRLVLWLLATLVLGMAFLGMEGTISPPWQATTPRLIAACSCPPSSCSSACTGCT